MITLDDWMVYAGVGLIVLIPMGSMILFLSIRNNAPEAFTHWKAARGGDVVCRVHYKGGKVKDWIGEIDNDEKGLGTNYWKIPEIGLKFKPSSDMIEFIEGSIPCVNYYENLTAGLKTAEIVAYDQLRAHFRMLGVSVDGIEKDAFYILAESEKLKDGERAIDNTKIKSQETRKYLKRFLDVVNNNKDELKKLRIESGIFSYQTTVKALDALIAFNGAAFQHAKEVIIAAALRKEEDNKKKMIEYAIIAVILAIAGIILLYGLKGL